MKNQVAATGVLFCFLVFLHCKNDKTGAGPVVGENFREPQPVHYITLTIDSLRAYKLGQRPEFYAQQFLFSPFDKNRVWFLNGNRGGFELDLETEEKILFSEKFGADFSKIQITTDGIHPDPEEQNICWFTNFHGGIYRYDNTLKKGWAQPLGSNQNGVNCLLLDADFVWIGTWKGLWAYNRRNGQCRMVDHSPQEPIYWLAFGQNGKLLVGGRHTYDPVNGCWEIAEPENQDSNPNTWVQYPPDLPSPGEDFKYAEAPGEKWYCGNTYWLLFNGIYRLHRPPMRKSIFHLKADSDNLYVLTPEAFLILNKQYLSSRYGLAPELIDKQLRLKQLRDSLKFMGDEEWASSKAKFEWLKNQFKDETDPFIQSVLKQISISIIPYRRDDLEIFLNEENLDTSALDVAYPRLLEIIVLAGELKYAQNVFAEFLEKRPCQIKHNEYPTDFDKLNLVILQLDSLDNAALEEDERLWRKGIALQQFASNTGFFKDEVSCTYTILADSIFRLLVHKFPKSKLAEEADYRLICNGLCYEGEDGSDHPEEVELWRNFLKAYTNTSRRAPILCNMAWALGRTESDLRKGLKLMSEAEKLRPELFNEQTKDNYIYMRKEFQRMLYWHTMQLTVHRKKNIFRRNEQIEVVFSLKNNSKETITVHLATAEGYPNFSVEVMPDEADNTCVKYPEFRESGQDVYPRKATDFRDFPLQSGKTYSETWTLTKSAWKYNNPKLGRFVLDQPGKYSVRAHLSLLENDKVSEPVFFEIE